MEKSKGKIKKKRGRNNESNSVKVVRKKTYNRENKRTIAYKKKQHDDEISSIFIFTGFVFRKTHNAIIVFIANNNTEQRKNKIK